jgi:hypothetical protein
MSSSFAAKLPFVVLCTSKDMLEVQNQAVVQQVLQQGALLLAEAAIALCGQV